MRKNLENCRKIRKLKLLNKILVLKAKLKKVDVKPNTVNNEEGD